MVDNLLHIINLEVDEIRSLQKSYEKLFNSLSVCGEYPFSKSFNEVKAVAADDEQYNKFVLYTWIQFENDITTYCGTSNISEIFAFNEDETQCKFSTGFTMLERNELKTYKLEDLIYYLEVSRVISDCSYLCFTPDGDEIDTPRMQYYCENIYIPLAKLAADLGDFITTLADELDLCTQIVRRYNDMKDNQQQLLVKFVKNSSN